MDHATKWIETAIVGGITKHDLDEARREEVNVTDMMQLQTITGHPESLLEL